MRGFFCVLLPASNTVRENFVEYFHVKLFSICFPVSCSTKYKWYLLFFFRPFCVSIWNLNCRKLKSFPQTHSQDHTYCETHKQNTKWLEMNDRNKWALVMLSIDFIPQIIRTFAHGFSICLSFVCYYYILFFWSFVFFSKH